MSEGMLGDGPAPEYRAACVTLQVDAGRRILRGIVDHYDARSPERVFGIRFQGVPADQVLADDAIGIRDKDRPGGQDPAPGESPLSRGPRAAIAPSARDSAVCAEDRTVPEGGPVLCMAGRSFPGLRRDAQRAVVARR